MGRPHIVGEDVLSTQEKKDVWIHKQKGSHNMEEKLYE